MRSDADIICATLSGDREAFAELVQLHYPLVYALALASLRNRSDAEDATQETFLRALKSLDSLKDHASFVPWLSSIVRNICRNERIKEVREERRAIEATSTASTIDTEPEGSELHALLWDHVMALPPGDREILILYYFSKHNTRAIAQLLSISVPAAEKRLQRARQSLGTRMEAALNETMDQHRHRDRAVNQTALAVLACPVTWKPIGASAAGIAGIAASVLSSWKTIAALVAVGLIGGGYLLRDEFAPVTPAAPVNTVAQKTSDGVPSSDNAKAETSVAKPAEAKLGFFQVLAKAIGRGPTGPTIHVVSQDDETKPIEGAQIAIFNEDDPNNILKGTTGPDGNCVLSRVPASGALLSVTHPDYLPQRRISVALKRTDSQTVRLEPFDGILIAGKVVSENTGKPIARFQLKIETTTGELPARWRNGFVQFDNGDGRFEVNAGKAPNRLIAIAPGYAAREIDISKNDVDLNNLAVRLASSYSVQVAVVDKSGGPIPHAKVRVRPLLNVDDEIEKAWHTDEFGRVRIADLSVRPEAIVAIHDDYVPEGARLSDDASMHELSLTIALLKATHITGVVMYEPYREVRVSVSLEKAETLSNGQDLYRTFKRTRTNRDGRFELNQIPAGQFEIVCTLLGRSIRQNITIPEDGIDNLVLRLPSGSDEGLARISGVVTIDGTPVAGGNADLKVVSSSDVYTDNVNISGENSDHPGFFAIDGVMPGNAEICFRVTTETGLFLIRNFSLEVPSGSNFQSNFDIKTGAPLFVRVVGPANTEASVLVRAAGQQVASFRCDVGVETEIRGLEAGRYTLLAWSLGPKIERATRIALSDAGGSRAPEPGSEEAIFQSTMRSAENSPQFVHPNEVKVELKEGNATRVELTPATDS